jgi:histidinol-phosphate/aromatic aminotransferase/cobyric acid decarboxylase-like protein
VARAIDAREWVTNQLIARGLRVVPSSANFVFVPLANAPTMAVAMRARGVAVRAFDGLPLVSHDLMASRGCALRISMGPAHEINAAVEALDAVRDACV